MIQAIATLKGWFQTGDKPTQAQFWDWMDSYFHKDELIPQDNVDGLTDALTSFASTADIDALKAIVITTSSSTASAVLPAGTILNKIRVKSSAAQTFSLGTTVGGTQVLSSELLNSNQVGIYVLDVDVENITTIYLSGLSGNNVIKIYLQQ